MQQTNKKKIFKIKMHYVAKLIKCGNSIIFFLKSHLTYIPVLVLILNLFIQYITYTVHYNYLLFRMDLNKRQFQLNLQQLNFVELLQWKQWSIKLGLTLDSITHVKEETNWKNILCWGLNHIPMNCLFLFTILNSRGCLKGMCEKFGGWQIKQ